MGIHSNGHVGELENGENMHCAFVYPGQGAHKATMADVVMEAFPTLALQIFQQAERATGVDLRAVAGRPNRDFLLESPRPEIPHHQNTGHPAKDVQAVVYTVSLITHLGLLESGWHPDVVAGHRLGSYAALAAAGCLSFTDGLHLVREHAALTAEQEAVTETVSSTSRARMADRLADVDFREPYLPVVGSGTAQPLRTGAQARQDLLAQVDGQDSWPDTMPLLVGRGRDVVVEVGPGRALTAQFAQSHPQVVTRSTADIRRIRRLTEHPARV